jgi:hypothetical protein
MLCDEQWQPLDAENQRKPGRLRPVAVARRSKVLFPINLPVRYKTGYKTGSSGAGRVVNIGSTHVMVACTHRLRVGTPVELVIEWPARLEGRIPIHLMMCGAVVRVDISGFAVGYCQYRFQLVEDPASGEQPDSLELAASDSSLSCVPAPYNPAARELALRARGPG